MPHFICKYNNIVVLVIFCKIYITLLYTAVIAKDGNSITIYHEEPKTVPSIFDAGVIIVFCDVYDSFYNAVICHYGFIREHDLANW